MQVKLYHCQAAGAVGVIFVDWDPSGRFTGILTRAHVCSRTLTYAGVC
jgi:hypothetical protein